ncbi:MAG: thioredoxin [bacterium]|nr:thioredoxin [bacterium]
MEIRLDDADFDDQVLRSELPVLVDFWAEWCAPCLAIAPTVAAIAREYAGKLTVCKLNVDEAPRTAARYEIRGIPSLVIFKGGKVAERIVGVISREALEGKIKPHIAGD